jgi:lactoylglutathione lyase
VSLLQNIRSALPTVARSPDAEIDHIEASVTLALATAIDHPIPGQVVVGIKTDDVDGAARAIEENGGGIVKGPYDDAHERRAVVYDNKGNGLVFYKSLPR